MPGICVTDNVTVGAGCCISKDLAEPGVYVNQPLRFLPSTSAESLKKFGQPVESYPSVDFYRK